MNKTKQVKQFYENFPYPNFKNKIKAHFIDLDFITDKFWDKKIEYLDVGCGTGNGTVGMALYYPNWVVSGIDLSANSIQIAKELAIKNNVDINFYCEDILKPILIDAKFDLITSFGTIHHCDDPKKAINNIVPLLKVNGFIVIHLYSKEQDREKFVIRELLDIFINDINDIENRFKIYENFKPLYKKSLLDMSINDLFVRIRDIGKIIKSRVSRIEPVPKWKAKYKSPNNHWVDHFCHPCEHTFDINNVKDLLDNSGLEIIKMLNLPGKDVIPQNLYDKYDALDQWKKWRVEELMMKNKKSILLIAQKIKNTNENK